jgi:hypothetical protein
MLQQTDGGGGGGGGDDDNTCSWPLNFHRKYSALFITCPFPSAYISTPNCSFISFSTSA